MFYSRVVVTLMAMAPTSLLAADGSVAAEAGADGFLQSWMPWEAEGSQALPALLVELGAEGELSSDRAQDISGRLHRLEDSLRSTFKAVPKNGNGKLGSAGVRYVLHRFFVNQHGWVVKGLHHEGEAWNSSFPLEFLSSHIGEALHTALEKRIANPGVSLHEIALLAAIVESLVHQEFEEKMAHAYNLNHLDIGAPASIFQINEVIDTYMAARIIATVPSMSLPRPTAARLTNMIPQVYPAWGETQAFMRQRREIASGTATTMTFQAVLSFMAPAVDEWGRWQNRECVDIKQKLLSVEDHHAGCVRLVDFYRARQEQDMWQFSESPNYLREHGILEESNRSDPHVMIPNYINGGGNCLPASHFYSTCCLDECEEMMGALEQRFQRPDVSAEQVAAALASMRGPLSPKLLARLEQVGDNHPRRLVSLHGRMFAQWLHHAYPRECPYPHLSGTTRQVSFWEYEAGAGFLSAALNDTEAGVVLEALKKNQSGLVLGQRGEAGTCAPWEDDEEMYVPRLTLAHLEQDAHVWVGACSVMGLCAFAVLSVALMRTLHTAMWGSFLARRLRGKGQNKELLVIV